MTAIESIECVSERLLTVGAATAALTPFARSAVFVRFRMFAKGAFRRLAPQVNSYSLARPLFFDAQPCIHCDEHWYVFTFTMRPPLFLFWQGFPPLSLSHPATHLA